MDAVKHIESRIFSGDWDSYIENENTRCYQFSSEHTTLYGEPVSMAFTAVSDLDGRVQKILVLSAFYLKTLDSVSIIDTGMIESIARKELSEIEMGY